MRIDLSSYVNSDFVTDLREKLSDAEEHFAHRSPLKSPQSIGASGSMFRVFRGIEKPSHVYKQWAFDTATGPAFERKVASLQCQKDFEHLHAHLGSSLETRWCDVTGQGLCLAHRCKILDLFVKRACELALPNPESNAKLLLYGHVPLDTHVFNALDAYFSGSLMLQGRRMGDVRTNQTYEFFQSLIREIMNELHSPPLFFEYYAWNLRA